MKLSATVKEAVADAEVEVSQIRNHFLLRARATASFCVEQVSLPIHVRPICPGPTHCRRAEYAGVRHCPQPQLPLRHVASNGTGRRLPDHPSLSFEWRKRSARLHISDESPGQPWLHRRGTEALRTRRTRARASGR